MKKSLLVLLAFLVVGALAFAAEPAVDLKIAEFTGDASVTLGFDIDRGMAAFSNATSVSLKVQLATGGTKDTTGEGIWGALQIKSGDVINITPGSVSAPALTVEKAQLNFGTIAYLGILKDGTTIDYAGTPDEAATVNMIGNSVRYGTPLGASVAAAGTLAPAALNAEHGVVLGITPAGIGSFTVDFRSVPAWGTQPFWNDWSARVKADITAVANLTAQAGVSYNLGVAGAEGQDLGVGGKVSYKMVVADPYYVMPTAAVDVQMNNEVAPATATMDLQAHAGVVFGWGAKAKFNDMFLGDVEYYPGVAVGVMYLDPDTTAADDDTLGLNISMFTGALVPNLTASVAFEIADLMNPTGTDMIMGFAAQAKYAIAMAPMTITPKFGVSYYSNTNLGTPEAETDIYVKAGLEIAKIFPNTTLSFAYNSNDFNGGADGVAAQTLGKFETTLKIAF